MASSPEGEKREASWGQEADQESAPELRRWWSQTHGLLLIWPEGMPIWWHDLCLSNYRQKVLPGLENDKISPPNETWGQFYACLLPVIKWALPPCHLSLAWLDDPQIILSNDDEDVLLSEPDGDHDLQSHSAKLDHHHPFAFHLPWISFLWLKLTSLKIFEA